MELAPMRVNTVKPSLIETPLWSRMPQADCKLLFASGAERSPARGIGQHDEITNPPLVLATTPFATGYPCVSMSAARSADQSGLWLNLKRTNAHLHRIEIIAFDKLPRISRRVLAHLGGRDDLPVAPIVAE